MQLGSVSFNQGVQFTPAPQRQRVLPQLEEAQHQPADSAILNPFPASPVAENQPSVPADASLTTPVVAKAPTRPVPQTLSMEMGEVGAGLLTGATAASGPSYSSSGQIANNTVGWSGEPAAQAPLHQSHRQQIHSGLQYMEEIMPGMRSKMDQLLHTSDPVLQGRLDAIVTEQNGLCTAHGRLLATPDDRLQPHQLKQKNEVNARIEALSSAYDSAQKALDDKTAANKKQAEQLAGVFLNKLRKQGRATDVRDRVKFEPSARAQLQKDGISEEQVGHWMNEFHHQTGLPAPRQLKLVFIEDRPNYNSQTDAVNIGAKFSKRLTLHEVAHRAEYRYPEISKANKDWVRARCEKGGFSSEPTRLSQLVPEGKYKDDEVALEDTFVDPYVGKVYPDLASEVLSMGLEHFSSEKLLTRLYTQDPEHVFLTLGAIKTMHGKDGW
ncbi:MAG: hypothetical protein U0931_06010 [Vulcanimicrobiota bacterium]